MPLGNVYYYFKTKQDIVEAVVQSHVAEAHAMLAALEDTYDNPRDRLRALFGALSQQADLMTREAARVAAWIDALATYTP